MLIKISIINLYALKHVGSNPDKIEELTNDEKKVRELTLELITGSLCAFLVPVHTLKMDDSLLDYYALPAIKFLLYFIRNEPDVLKEKVFTNKLQIWPSLVKLLNNSQKYLKVLNYNKYNKLPLPEDKNLQGFLPFSRNFKEIDFKNESNDLKIERLVRMKRIVDIGLWLTDIDVNGNKLITKSEVNGDIIFEPGCIQPDPTNDLLEEMKSFSVSDNPDTTKIKSIEKKAGILKPQGSLEKSREERELITSNSVNTIDSVNTNSLPMTSKAESAKSKRGKQNVALQSIFKKMEESNKQVKFSVDELDKEKSGNFDSSPPQQKPQQQNNAEPTNHPAFPIAPPSQPDYLTSLRNMPNVPLDKGPSYQFPKNDSLPQNMPNIGMPIIPPYQSMQRTPNSVMGMNQKPPNAYQQGPLGQNSFNNPQMPGPYQNMPFPSTHGFGSWKREEIPPLPNPSWWQNANHNQPAPSQNYRQENYHLNFPAYSNNVPPYLQQSNHLMPKHDFGKPTSSQGGGDIFSSPWTGTGMRGQGGGMGFENNSQGMSMRQAMLKEANLPGVPVGPSGSAMGRISHPPPQENKFIQNQNNTPGYSLFNTNSWTPNLAGQLRSNKHVENTSASHLPQQSLFSGHSPKSLAQLLEHQQSQLNKDL
ncbi:hypothetical protein NQ317_002458 [Molorchus minor]|uniref:DNA/RNA-binding domain-containing protein n=1 Tax=Molorchus minor TaxID=1323400 RepID=A0ABQ9JHH7_9CUCU|nr:hypothetical protein NQ317_002458 [Molorchus minor]